MPSFKVPCPSCETKVLIKNPNLVGTKVECPKCKYRFKVEAPTEEAAADEGKAGKGKDAKAAAPADDAGKKAAKGKKNNKKFIGVGLGVVAVALLGVGGFAIFGSGDGKKGPTGGGGSRGAGGFTSNTNNATQDEGTSKDQQPGQPPPKPVPSLPLSDKDPTNLLPRETVAVYRFDLDRLRQTPLGGTLFDRAMADLFRTSTGIDPANVEKYFHCTVGEKDRAPFGLIRLKEPVGERDVRMIGAKAGKTVNGKTLFPVAGNPFFTAVGHALSARSFLGDFYDQSPTGTGNATAKEKPLGVCVYDTQTIFVGDHAVLEKFLTGLKDGYPEFQTVLRKDNPPPAPTPAPMGGPAGGPMSGPVPMSGATPVPGPGGAAGTPMPPAAPPPPKPAGPAAPTKDYTTNPSYMSLSPDLKKMLNGLEDEPGGQPLMVLAEKFDNAAYDRKGVKRAYESVVKVVDPILTRAQYIGLTLTAFTPRQLAGSIQVVGKSADEARHIALDHLTPDLADGVPVLSLLLLTPIELRNFADPNAGIPGGAEGPGGPFQPGSPGGPPGYPMGPPGSTPGYPMGPPGSGSSSGPPRPPITPGGPGPGGNPGYMPRPGGSETQPGYTGSGSMGGPPRPGGPGRPGPSTPGYPMGPGMTPMGPGMTPMGPGMTPGGPGVEPKQPTEPPSHIDLRLTDQVVTLSLEINFSQDVYDHFLFPRLSGMAHQLKGKAAVFAGNNTWHGLAQAVNAYVEKNKKFPRGTVDRPASDQTRLNLPYPPVQRLSFFAELLPYIHGRETIGTALNRGAAWYDDSKTSKNADTAGSWVPELLVSYYPQSSWRATSPLAPEHTFGGTNFVAIAGIGADAGRYNPDNPAVQKLVGISGYAWGSKVGEVTDGLANTIYLMQVPPGFPRPWAAGGGATVMGVDPKNPMADFKFTRPDGQVGTYAIMGDGAVRWIPADIDPKVLLAMVTRAGGEKIPDLDKVAPRVGDTGKTNDLKADVPVDAKGGPAPAGGPAAPVAPKATSDGPVKPEQAPAPRAK